MPDLSNFSATPAAKSASPEPSVVAALERIEQRLARLEGAVAQLDTLARTAPGVLATVTDTLDHTAARLAESGIDVDERMRTSLRLLERLTAPRAASAFETLLGSSLVDERVVGALGKVAAALAAEADHEPAAVGPWGVFRSLGDSDVQHAVGFLLAIAKRLGASFAQPAPHELPPASNKR
jgi:hypothetical protein